MRATNITVAIAATLVASLAGCGGGTNGGGADMATAAPDMTVVVNGCPSLMSPIAKPGDDIGGDAWTSFAKPFFATWCTRCHSTTLAGTNRNGAPDGYNWDDEASVRAHLSMIRNAIGVQNFMPPTAPIPSCDDRRRLVRWIDAGAP